MRNSGLIFKRAVVFVFAGLTAVFLCSGSCFGMEISVTSWGEPNIVYFSWMNPPSDLKEYGGDATGLYKVNGEYTNLCNEQDGVFKAGNLKLKLSGHTEIRLALGSSQSLKNHELGHDKLNKFEYEKYAKKKLAYIFQNFEKLRKIPDGKTCEDMRKYVQDEYDYLVEKFLKAIKKQADQLSKWYDAPTMTDHGSVQSPSADEAVEKVKKKREEADKKREQAGQAPFPGLAPGRQQVTFMCQPMDMNDVLIFDQQQYAVMVQNGNPADTLTGELMAIEDIIVLGPDEEGIIRCADTYIEIENPAEPNWPYLLAAVEDIRLRENSFPAGTYAVQGYLNVWMVENVIGSEFLDYVQAASDANQYLSFWMYFDEQLYDGDGSLVLNEVPFNAELFIGTGKRAETSLVDDFDSYDPGALATVWTAAGGGFAETAPGMGRFASQAMALEYMLNPAEMVTVMGMFIPPIDLSDPERKSFDIWMNPGADAEILDEFAVILSGPGGTPPAIYDSAGFNPYPTSVITSTDDTWVCYSIDARNFSDAIDMAMIEQVIIEFHNNGVDPLTGMLYIDDIGASNARKIEKPRADISGDYEVGLPDLAIMAQTWLANGLWPAY